MLEIGEAYLHEGNLKALAWERQVPKIKNTSYLVMTNDGFKHKRTLPIHWLARVSDIEYLGPSKIYHRML